MARGQDLEAPPPRRRRTLPLLLPGAARPADRPTESLRYLLLERWPGRVLLGALAAKAVLWLVEALVGATAVGDALGLVVRLALLVTLAYFVWRLIQLVRQRLLWRVRQRLIVSYVFIGVVPALLIVAFFLFGGALMFFNVSAYLFKTGVNDIVGEARIAAQAAAEELERSRGMRAAIDVLQRRFENNEERYPGLSLALVPRATEMGNPEASAIGPLRAGEWKHMDPPESIPAWVSAGGFGGMLAYTPADARDEVQLVVRAVGFPTSRDAKWGVVIDVPVDEQVLEQIHQATGVEPGDITLRRQEGDVTRPIPGRARGEDSAPAMRAVQTDSGKWIVNWVVYMDFIDWLSGNHGSVSLGIRVSPRDIYERISSAQSRILGMSIGELTLFVLGFIGVLFLVIEFAAFIMGLALARSITGSIHALFLGTERVRQGDFAHRIPLRSRDQLGELAESFNTMTSNIEDLLQQAAEKRRLEEELRIAREIQMSLLPRGAMGVPGLAVTALCVPAREVGGDYYDFFPLDESRIGVLIADVAGKGTSAALYMAELKGLVLSLSKIYHSPRQLLVEANRILSSNLDSRSFITMTYAVVDVAGRTVSYSRAGHTPMIHLPAAVDDRPRRARVLTPNGMVVGLPIEGMTARFEELLEELTIPLHTGDVFVLFTDGVTEAMNLDSDLFGEDRLRALVEEHGELSSEELRERIVREVEAFVGDADPHDDMTMILLKVEEAAGAQAAGAPITAEAVAIETSTTPVAATTASAPMTSTATATATAARTSSLASDL
jgi:sigma-B regulation protein RsbU (phosphoserine phosphatase)